MPGVVSPTPGVTFGSPSQRVVALVLEVQPQLEAAPPTQLEHPMELPLMQLATAKQSVPDAIVGAGIAGSAAMQPFRRSAEFPLRRPLNHALQ